MRDEKSSHSSYDPILEEYRKNESRIMENECITGSEYLEKDTDKISLLKKHRTLYLLTQLMFFAGIVIALILWISK